MASCRAWPTASSIWRDAPMAALDLPRFLSAGTVSAARMPRIEITTSISISVKPGRRRVKRDARQERAWRAVAAISPPATCHVPFIHYCQLITLSLLKPWFAAVVGSIFPSGPADQTMTLPRYCQLSGFSALVEPTRPFQPMVPLCWETTFGNKTSPGTFRRNSNPSR